MGMQKEAGDIAVFAANHMSWWVKGNGWIVRVSALSTNQTCQHDNF